MVSLVNTDARLALAKGNQRATFRNPRGTKYYYAIFIDPSDNLRCKYSPSGAPGSWTFGAATIYTGTVESYDVKIHDTGSQLDIFVVLYDSTAGDLTYVKCYLGDSDNAINVNTAQDIDTDINTESGMAVEHSVAITRTANAELVVAFTEDYKSRGKNYRQTKLIGSNGDGAAPTWDTTNEEIVDDPSFSANNQDKDQIWVGLESFSSSYGDRVLIYFRQPFMITTTNYVVKLAVYTHNYGTGFSSTASDPTGNGAPDTGRVFSAIIDDADKVHIVFFEDAGTDTIKHNAYPTAGSLGTETQYTVKTPANVDALCLAIDRTNDDLYCFYHDVGDTTNFHYKTTDIGTVSWGSEETITFSDQVEKLSCWIDDIEDSLHILLEDDDTDVYYHELDVSAGPETKSVTKNSNARIKVLGESVTKNSNARIKVEGDSVTKNSDARIKSTEAVTKNSDARIFVEGLDVTKNSNARIKVEEQSVTKTSDARVVLTNEFTKTSDARIFVEGLEVTKNSNARIKREALSVTKNSDARIKVEGSEVTKTSDTKIMLNPSITKNSDTRIFKQGISVTKNSDARIVLTEEVTKTSDARIFNTMDVTKNSDARIKRLGLSVTKNSDARIVYTDEVTKNSDARIKSEGLSVTKTSDARIFKTLSVTKNSDARVVPTEEVTKTSDARILVEQSITKNSDARIYKLGIEVTKNSDARIKKIIEVTKNSDARIKREGLEVTKNSDARIFKVGEISKTSDAKIILVKSITKTSDAYIIGTYQVTKTSDAQIATSMQGLKIFKTSDATIMPYDWPPIEGVYRGRDTEEETILRGRDTEEETILRGRDTYQDDVLRGRLMR